MYFIGLITLLVYDQSINSTGEVTLELREKRTKNRPDRQIENKRQNGGGGGGGYMYL